MATEAICEQCGYEIDDVTSHDVIKVNDDKYLCDGHCFSEFLIAQGIAGLES